MRILTISNIKGGVGKTTTAAILAAGINRRGNRVLMIDSDPQGNLTSCFIKSNDNATLYDIYDGQNDIREAAIEVKPGLDIIAGDFALCSSELEFLPTVGSLKMLRKALKGANDLYDYVVIDTPPNLGFLSLNAMMACNAIVTPLTSESFSLKAISLLKNTLVQVEEEREITIPVLGLLLTKYSGRTRIEKALEESIQSAAELLGTTVFNSRIRQATVVQQCQLMRRDLYELAPKDGVTQDYDDFVEEVLERMTTWQK